jgi:gas vesicle protein
MQEYPDFIDSGKSSTKITPFMFGAVLGAGIALLLAPGHGKDTRRRVGHTVRRLGDNARQVFKRTSENLNEIKRDAKSAIDKGRQEYMRSRRPEDQLGTRPAPAV